MTKNNSILSFLLNSSRLNLINFTHARNNSISINFNDKYSAFDNINSLNFNYNLKDVYFLFNDYDLLNKENLNFLYWLNSSASLNNLNFFYFDYFSNSSIFNFNNSQFTTKSNCELILNTYLITSLNNLDSMYLDDVEFLTFF